MKKFLIAFILFSQFAQADLRQALNDFEEAATLKLKVEDYTKRLTALTEAQEKMRPVLNKTINEGTTLLNTKFQASADEFVKLRLKGATLPIAYLEYMKMERLAKIPIACRWDEVKLRSIEDTRNEECMKNELDPIKTSYPFPRIPVCLIKESQESLATSLQIAQIRNINDNATKKKAYIKLWNHYESSASYNYRSLFHICDALKNQILNLQKNEVNSRLWDLIDSWGKGTKGMASYLSRHKSDKKVTLNCCLDPDYVLFFAYMFKADFEMANTIAIYESRNAQKISESHSVIGMKQKLNKILEDDSELMTAFQNGCTPVNAEISINGITYNKPTALDFLANNLVLSPQDASYIGFLGFDIYGSQFCASVFEQFTSPFCSRYTGTLANGLSFDPKVSPQEAFSRYRRLQHYDREMANKYLSLANKPGNPEGQYEFAKMQIHSPVDKQSKKRAYQLLKSFARQNSKAPGMRTTARALLATLHLLYEKGDPQTCYTYAKLAVENRDEVTIDPPSYGLLAYYVYNGIGCKKDVEEAKRIAARDTVPSLWWHAAQLPELMKQLSQEKNENIAYHTVRDLFNKYLNEGSRSDFLPDFPFLFDKLYHLVETLNTSKNETTFAALQIYAQIIVLASHKNFEKYCYYAANIVRDHPDLRDSFAADARTGEQPIKILTFRQYLEKAVAAEVPEACLMKARCLYRKEDGYGKNDRKTDLEAALVLINNFSHKHSLEDKITKRLIQNELNSLNQQAESQQDIEASESESEDDSDEALVQEPVAAPAVTTPASSRSSSSSIQKPKLSAAQIECENIIAAARHQSHMKKKGLTLEHSMTLPENYKASEKQASQYKVTAETAEFVNMVFGFGEKRVHQYNVDSAAVAFADLGFVDISTDQTTWSLTAADGIVHKLSLHRPHRDGNEDLYLAIRTRIKRVFERLGITPDNLKIKK